MKNNNRLSVVATLLFVCCLFINIRAWGQQRAPIQFSLDGIVYRKTPYSNNEVMIYGGNDDTRLVIRKVIRIPPTVSYNGIQYTVVSLGWECFEDREPCEGNNDAYGDSLILPNTIRQIMNNPFSRRLSYMIPENVEKIGYRAFGNTTMDSIYIPCNVKSIAPGAFLSSIRLKSIQVDTANSAYTAIDGVLYNKQKTELVAYPTGRKTTTFKVPNGVTHIAKYAFYEAFIDSLVIPESVISIGNDAFKWCRKLQSISLPNSVINIAHGAFDGTAWYRSQVDGSAPRARCPYWELPLNTLDYNSRWAAKRQFRYHSTKVSALFLGNILYKYVPYSHWYIKRMEDSRRRCFSIKGCYSFPKTIIIPEGIRTIAEEAFFYGDCHEYCEAPVSTIVLPESLEYMKARCFKNCKQFKTLHVPQNVGMIDVATFDGSYFRKIHVYWQDPSYIRIYGWGKKSNTVDAPFYPENKKRCKLIVPKGTKEKYKEMLAWHNFTIVERKE
jgi:hypothetical protein